MVRAIYSDRTFIVADSGVVSESRRQRNGISQGCPLSPFLFSIVMTVILHDARASLGGQSTQKLTELVYADDTLLIGSDDVSLQTIMMTIGQVGSEYGLSYNWKKLEALPVRTSAEIRKPDGSLVATKPSMLYLGSGLSADGRNGSEINRRLGTAKSDFSKLCKVWAHSDISRDRKMCIFNACVVSALSYGLVTMVFTKAEQRRIDGFQCRCLRKILGIAPAYWSRVPNTTVLQIACQLPLTDTLRKERMIYMGHIARRSYNDCVRNVVFEDGSTNIRSIDAKRPRGRPRRKWTDEVMRDCLTTAGSQRALHEFFQATPAASAAWRRAVQGGCG